MSMGRKYIVYQDLSANIMFTSVMEEIGTVRE